MGEGRGGCVLAMGHLLARTKLILAGGGGEGCVRPWGHPLPRTNLFWGGGGGHPPAPGLSAFSGGTAAPRPPKTYRGHPSPARQQGAHLPFTYRSRKATICG